jgi:23S rRNA (adenine2030-N6)-methyltransferase
MPQSRYRPDDPPDYGHRFHAGNIGDVWKHCALVEILSRVAAAREPVAYVESHAGDGCYPLAGTGEWSEGIGRLWNAEPTDLGDGAAARYVALARRLAGEGAQPRTYPGSPALARELLGADARLTLWERDAGAFARLGTEADADPRVRLRHGDGFAGLADAVRQAESESREAVVLVDPSYGQKAEWSVAGEAFARAARSSTRACLVLWYPVKSLTRPNALLARLEAAGVAGTIAELVTAPLGERRNRLNGSGLLVVRPPAGTLEALAAAAPVIGRICAIRAGTWSLRMVAGSARDDAASASPGSGDR